MERNNKLLTMPGIVGAVSKRFLTLPVVLTVGICNVLYGVYLSLSHDPTHSSATSLRGLSELLHQRDHRGSAMKRFVQEQADGSDKSHNDDGSRKLHALHKPGLPSLVLHVGPQYTFASELQVELKSMAPELTIDQYALEFSSDTNEHSLAALVTDMRCHHSLTRARKRYDAMKQPKDISKRQSLKEYLSEVRCWKRALVALEAHRSLGQSVILSDELISTRWYHSSDGLGLTSLDWIAMEETLVDLWNVEIVVGYRRYAEWLPDAVRGAAEWRRDMVLADGNPPLKRVEPKPSDVILPLFPNLVEAAVATGEVVAPSTLLNATYTATVIQRYLYRDVGLPVRIPVTLLNAHADQSLGATFVCHILYQAPAACRVSDHRTATLSRELSDMNHKRNMDPVQALDFYEILATYCASQNMFAADKYSVQDAMISIRYYQEEILQKRAADLFQTCPTPEQVQVLLAISLKHELNLLPSFANSHNGNEEHRRSFRDTVEESSKLCGINVQKNMNDPGMLDFVHSLPRGVPPERLSVVTKPPTRPPTRPPTSAPTKEHPPKTANEQTVAHARNNEHVETRVIVDRNHKATGRVITIHHASVGHLVPFAHL